MNLEAVLEGLLFVSGDEGLTINNLVTILEISEEEIKELIIKLKQEYEKDNRGLRINYLGDALKLTTKKEHAMYYQKLIENPNYNGLSQAALETLAIIVYNQPITRVKIDEMRGISSGQMIRKLVAKGFVKEAGKSDLPGRPNLYKTTSEFLDYFGLASLSDLPKIDSQIENLEEAETDLFMSKYKEEEF